MDFTDSFVSYIRSFCDRDFSKEEEHQAKRCILDWLGVSEAGAFSVGKRLDSIKTLSSNGKCSCFLTKDRIDLITASFLNSFVAHELELDDGHRRGMLHLEAPIISALISVSQHESLKYGEFIKGMIAGYQTMVKIAGLIQPGHKLKGFHATGTCGAIGVASAVAVALGFSESEHINAIGAATTRAAGLLAALDSPSELKPYNIAGAVEVGIRSAYMAKAGFRGPKDALAGNRGFLKVYAPDKEIKTDSLDDVSEILKIYFKPYVSCRHCHAPIEAALLLKQNNNIDLGMVRDIRVETYRLAIGGHDSKGIESVSDAKMSIPYCTAVSLLKGSCGMDSFTDVMVADGNVKALMQKVCVCEDEQLTLATPDKRGARVIVTMNNGQQFVEMVENPLGEPENPMSDAMIESKYNGLMKFAGIEKSKTNMLKDMIWNLEYSFDKLLDIL